MREVFFLFKKGHIYVLFLIKRELQKRRYDPAKIQDGDLCNNSFKVCVKTKMRKTF